ncbi:hypothetical protein ACFYW6_25755 [Streptomyces sp. NPDC002659]
MAFEEADAVREFPSYRGQKNLPGLYCPHQLPLHEVNVPLAENGQ